MHKRIPILQTVSIELLYEVTLVTRDLEASKALMNSLLKERSVTVPDAVLAATLNECVLY